MAFRQEGLAQLAEAERKVTAAELANPDGKGRPSLPAGAPAVPQPGSPEDRWRSAVRRTRD
jgi:hypothetical protein